MYEQIIYELSIKDVNKFFDMKWKDTKYSILFYHFYEHYKNDKIDEKYIELFVKKLVNEKLILDTPDNLLLGKVSWYESHLKELLYTLLRKNKFINYEIIFKSVTDQQKSILLSNLLDAISDVMDNFKYTAKSFDISSTVKTFQLVKKYGIKDKKTVFQIEMLDNQLYELVN